MLKDRILSRSLCAFALRIRCLLYRIGCRVCVYLMFQERLESEVNGSSVYKTSSYI